MKQFTPMFLFFLLLGTGLHAQKKKNSFPADRSTVSAPIVQMSTKGLSPRTAFLLLDLIKNEKDPQSISEQQLIHKYGLIRKGDQLFVNSFILGTDDFSMSSLGESGVLPGSHIGDVYTALIPVNRLTTVAANAGVRYVDIGVKEHLYMDSARAMTNVDKVHQGLPPLNMPYTGHGVVVGDIDVGVDFTHPNFYDTTGLSNYRIKRAWVQNSSSGTPPAGYAYGSEYATEADILNAQTDDTLESHGTHTAGTAAGAGGYAGSPYRGVAYESDIVIVTTDLQPAKVLDAIKYIQDYAASVGKPCVINMSFGGVYGAHDGTDIEEVAMDSLAGPGKLMVRAAGNDGHHPIYVDHHFVNSDSFAFTILTSYPALHAGEGAVFYGMPNENFRILPKLYNIVTDNVVATTYPIIGNINSMSQVILTYNGDTMILNTASGIDALNNRPSGGFYIDYTNIDSTSPIKLGINIRATNTTVSGWAGNLLERDNAVRFTDYGLPFDDMLDGRTDHTVSVGACGEKVITVGAYTSKTEWTSLNVGPQSQGFWATAPIGEIAPFSSKGPTIDGRTKPDITAPGNVICSSVNRFDRTGDYDANSNLVVKDITVGGHTWYMGTMQGTSMSCPMVTGIIALWLEKYPNLTPGQALNLIKASAISDNYTGIIPAAGDNTWGWGKINAFLGMTVNVIKTPERYSLNVYPNPAQRELHIQFDSRVSEGSVSLFDMSGKMLYSKEISHTDVGYETVIDMVNHSAGIYLLKVDCNRENTMYKIVKQ